MRYSLHDGPGIRTTVFFKGCPLRCWWCHNPECQSTSSQLAWRADLCRLCGTCLAACSHGALQQLDNSITCDTRLCQSCYRCADACLTGALSVIGRRMSPQEVLQEVSKDLIFYEESGGGVTFSGGEPLMQFNFLEEVLRLCRSQHIHAAVDTSGFAPLGVLQQISRWTDLFLYDLKLIDDDRHRHYTGVSNQSILANLEWLLSQEIPVIVSIPIIPGINDDSQNLEQTGNWLAKVKRPLQVRLLPYHAIGAGKYPRLGREYALSQVETPNEQTMEAVREQLSAFDLDVQVGGD